VLDHGVTCSDQGGGQYHYSIDDSSPSGKLTADTKGKGAMWDRGRAGLPDSLQPGPHPCSGVSLDTDPD
jgi:hypothetical protein